MSGISGSVAGAVGADGAKSGLNSVLVDYVKQQGFVATAQTLAQEISGAKQLVGGKRARQETPQLEALRASYNALRNWLLKSLDEFRDELWPVLWVVFVHEYLVLVESGDTSSAVAFRDAFEGDHMYNHHDDLLELKGVLRPEQVRESTLAQRVLKYKFQLKMRSYARELLLSFLMENSYLQLLNIVNERVDILVGAAEDRAACLALNSTGVLEMDASSNILTGIDSSKLSSIRETPVQWTVPVLFKSLLQGATGAQAAAKSHPAVPPEYKAAAARQNKDVQDGNQERDTLHKLIEFEHDGQTVNVMGRMTKLDRHAEKLARKAAGDDSASRTASSAIERKRKPKNNHIGGKDSQPDLNSAYFTEITTKLLEPLRMAEFDAAQLLESTLGTLAAENAKAASRSVGLKDDSTSGGFASPTEWPSIALHTFFNAHDSLVCVDVSRDAKVHCAGFADSIVRVWYHPQPKNKFAGKPVETLTKSDPTVAEEGQPTGPTPSPKAQGAPASQNTQGSQNSQESNSQASENKPASSATEKGASQGDSSKPATPPDATEGSYIPVEPICEELIGHSGAVYGCSVSPDGESILTASQDATIRLWMRFPEIAGADQEDQEDPAEAVDSMDVDDGNKAASAKKKKRSRRSTQRKPFQQGCWRNVFAYRVRPGCPVWDVKFSPVGHYFATGSYDGIARIWAVDRPEPLRLLNGHLADVNCVAWHPNCQYMASGSIDKTIRVWDVPTGNCVRLLCGHLGSVNTVVFGSSGRYIVTGAQDKLVVVWDFATGERVSVLDAHTAPVWSVAVSPDNNYLVSGCADGAVRVWDCDRIWGKGSKANFLAVQGLDPYSASVGATTSSSSASSSVNADNANNKEKVIHFPKSVRVPPSYRSFPTKYTPIHFVRFFNERLILASGSFALPVMKKK
mmetsp:Transcript_699/g.1017  ORF Transcript_699/g.1017 Transcript_699/m.1017 type:complete len:913 (+) Transcript_699:281-3019(+)